MVAGLWIGLGLTLLSLAGFVIMAIVWGGGDNGED